MSEPIGSGFSEKQYDRNKRARDNLERDLVKHGTRPEKAKEIADRTARETDNKRKQEGQG